jgi:oxepin-CoA hydrolase/3-oxo-5,6-dehydrosuberyl-CoA semialdehyde dehydrogenase
LVSSIYGDQSRFLAEAISGLARWNGRVVVIDEQVADKSLHPGLVTPQLLHGGPGRAGGGEELGGKRGMRFYQHRSALQGNGPKIARLLKQR